MASDKGQQKQVALAASTVYSESRNVILAEHIACAQFVDVVLDKFLIEPTDPLQLWWHNRSLKMKPIIVGISGATGIVYGIRALTLLRELDIETHLVLSTGAKMTVQEIRMNAGQIEALATHVHHQDNLGAVISSGSFRTAGMMVMPCSMRSLAAIAHAAPYNLLTRAADVTLKERRRLVLLTREAPFNQAHMSNMLAATQMGAVIYPPVPALYAMPQTIEEMIDYTVMRVLDLFDIESPLPMARWSGMSDLTKHHLRKETEAGVPSSNCCAIGTEMS